MHTVPPDSPLHKQFCDSLHATPFCLFTLLPKSVCLVSYDLAHDPKSSTFFRTATSNQLSSYTRASIRQLRSQAVKPQECFPQRPALPLRVSIAMINKYRYMSLQCSHSLTHITQCSDIFAARPLMIHAEKPRFHWNFGFLEC